MLHNPDDDFSPQPLHQEGWFEGARKLKLYYQSWQLPQAEPPQGVCVLVHGLGSHSGLFYPLAERLVAENYRVYTFDLRGHGQSQGQRAYVRSWSEFRDDLRQFLHLVSLKEKGRPCFLMGHSLGGAIALDYALRFPAGLQGLILTAPALSVQGISPIKIKVGKLLSLLWPRFSLNTGLKDGQPPSRDEAVNQAYNQDPLRHTRGTARLSTEFLNTNHHTWQQIDQLALPLLLLQGDSDPVAPVAVAQQLFEQVETVEKQLHIYPGAYHEICNDINREEVFSDLCRWLSKQGQNELELNQPYRNTPEQVVSSSLSGSSMMI